MEHPLSNLAAIKSAEEAAVRELTARLSALRLMLIGGLASSTEAREFHKLATRLMNEIGRFGSDADMALLQLTLAKFARARDLDAALALGRIWVEEVSLFFSKRERWANRLFPPFKSPSIAMAMLCAALLALLGCTLWYNTQFLNRVVFPKRVQRLAELAEIKSALERFHHDHERYPLSVNDGKSWSGWLWPASDANWIPELVPEYIAQLPLDPRHAATPYMQYIYKSDGRNYKLLTVLPEDCAVTVKDHPEMSDKVRNQARCTSYGYWTAAAEIW
jgi:hypothetical protein